MMQKSWEKQQEMMNQLLMTLTINQMPPQNQSQHSTMSPPINTGIQERFSPSPSNPFQFLSSQILHFSGTEDEDVELWIEKIETVADLHSLSPVVKLTAAASKLSKTTRRWFDLTSGPINSSWVSFKEEIIDRFRREVLFNEII